MSSDPSLHKRVVLHVDLDAFYVACERELNPSTLLGRPVAVSQYNPHGNLNETKSSDVERRLIVRGQETNTEEKTDVVMNTGMDGTTATNDGKNGSMIAVSYEARAAGVKRGDRGYDAVKKCPRLCIVQVPVKRGKADLTMYRSASRRIIDVLIESFLVPIPEDFARSTASAASIITRADILVEKASIDEIYIDLSVAVDKIVAYMEDDYNHEERNKFWNQVLHFGRDIGATSIGGVEILSTVAKAANELSKDEVRRGASCQVMEQHLDSASTTWWNRSIEDWTEIEIRLAIGAYLAAQARESVRMKFKTNDMDVFTLSGGISSNKTLAKLASGLKKPNRQTIINATDEKALRQLFHPLKLNRIRGLGGKFGENVSSILNIETVGDLAMIPLTKLKSSFPSNTDDEKPIADFLYDISRGNCTDPVKERTLEKSMSSGKTFRKNLAIPIKNDAAVKRWLGELSAGLLERLEIDFEDNARIPSLLILSVRLRDTKTISRSTKAPSSLSEELYKATAFQLFDSHFSDQDGFIEGMTITGTNFQEVAKGRSTITDAFKRVVETCPGTKKEREKTPQRQPLSKQKRTIETLWNNMKSQNENASNGKIDSPSPKRIQKDSSSGNMSNLKEGKIDKDILSSLPPSIQSEIRIAEMSKIGSSSQNKRSTEAPKKGSIDKFFQPKANFTTAPKQQHKDPSLEPPPSFQRTALTHDDIDPSVLAELPFHIQAMIKKEIRQARIQR